jgi:hypothetical protein
MMRAGAAGLVVRVRGERRFVPATLVQKVVTAPRLSPVPGSHLQLALVDGRVVPVVGLGANAPELVVCHSDGELVALAGLTVEESGFFPVSGDGIRHQDETLPPLDLQRELALASSRAATKHGSNP